MLLSGFPKNLKLVAVLCSQLVLVKPDVDAEFILSMRRTISDGGLVTVIWILAHFKQAFVGNCGSLRTAIRARTSFSY